jgi:hypothetical protein
MANLGNAWHIPQNPEPRGRGAMRDPVGAIVPGMDVFIFTGNQFQGGGNPGNQLQTGSSLFVKRASEAGWTELPLRFRSRAENNKYYAATIPARTSQEFGVGEDIQYYLRIAYDDHDTTFLHARGDASATTADEPTAQMAPFTFTLEDPAQSGLWEPVFTFPNAAIHTHVLPNGRVLMWGRRDPSDPDNLDVQKCTPFVWNPETPLNPPDPQTANAPPAAVTVSTDPPKDSAGKPVNLFCSGHAFLPDGRLLVVGGHLADSDGLNQATTYTAAPPGSDEPGTWTPITPMGQGDRLRRWYPTATTLPNGGVLVVSGSYKDPNRPTDQQTEIVPLLQIWDNDRWRTIPKPNGGALDFIGLPLYPRMHVVSDGRVFMSGTNARTLLLETSAPGGWTEVDFREAGLRDYCPAVMFDTDRIIYIGGGNESVPDNASPDEPRPPTAQVEVIHLTNDQAEWQPTEDMHFPRRQHNAVILPDGTVLVIGGTRGGGGARPAKGVTGFNDLRPGQPVHAAELWDPQGNGGRGVWRMLAAEETDRCYHSTAVLLPDARVLSAGGGEYRPDDVNTNNDQDTHHEAQIFSPPYLFLGDRPVIASAPGSVRYGEAFEVQTPDANDIATVSWIRLPSVTHSFDQNQRINFLTFTQDHDTLTVTAPDTPQACPPGDYMLFILTEAGVPSTATIVQIQAQVGAAPQGAEAVGVMGQERDPTAADVGYPSEASTENYGYEFVPPAAGTPVLIGINGTCPYGIGSCWGGAYDALGRLEGVHVVNPVPNTQDSTAQVFLRDERLPALDRWAEQFRHTVNGTYQLRGFEVTLRGPIGEQAGQLLLRETESRPEVQLVPLSIDKVQWDPAAEAPKPPEQHEIRAHADLAASGLVGEPPVTLTGPLTQTESGYRLHVRSFEA